MLGAATIVALTSGAALGQTVTNVGDTQTGVNITFTGIIQSSVALTLTGKDLTTLSGTANAVNDPATGTVDFGSFSVLGPLTVTNGQITRTSSGTSGVLVIADLIATLVYQGTTTGTILVTRASAAGAPPDVPLANLRIASPPLPLAAWTSETSGTQVPDASAPGFSLCTANGRDTTCQDAVAYDHQLAVFVPQTQPAGDFSTVVLYSGTAP